MQARKRDYTKMGFILKYRRRRSSYSSANLQSPCYSCLANKVSYIVHIFIFMIHLFCNLFLLKLFFQKHFETVFNRVCFKVILYPPIHFPYEGMVGPKLLPQPPRFHIYQRLYFNYWFHIPYQEKMGRLLFPRWNALFGKIDKRSIESSSVDARGKHSKYGL